MSIDRFRYFDASGQEGYAGTPDDPYNYPGPYQSELGNRLFNSNRGVRWHFVEGSHQGDVELTFCRTCRAVVDTPATRIVVVGEMAPKFAWPHNAAVFDQDGSLNHVIKLPDHVEHDFGSGDFKRYSSEGFRAVFIDNSDIVLSVYFQFEWFQNRVYDPNTQTWGRVMGIGRN